jgi:TatD DNase family protein
MILTDTHTHLYYQEDDVKRAGLIQRCVDNDVKRLFLPNVDAASVPLVYDLVNAYPNLCYPMLGLHPCSVKGDWEQELATIKASIRTTKFMPLAKLVSTCIGTKLF